MGVLSYESTRIKVIIVKFPLILSMYMQNRNRKIKTFSSGSSVNSERMNSFTRCDFSFLITDLFQVCKCKKKQDLVGPTLLFKNHFCWFKKCACVCMCTQSVMSHSLGPHGLQPTRYLCPWRLSWQEYWSGLPFASPWDLPNPGIEPRSPALWEDSLSPGKPENPGVGSLSLSRGTS